jgi:hypothetical protein
MKGIINGKEIDEVEYMQQQEEKLNVMDLTTIKNALYDKRMNITDHDYTVKMTKTIKKIEEMQK